MFYFDESAMNDMLSLVTKNIGEMHDMEDGYLENMEPISNSGVYGNGIQMIDSQIVSIKDGLTDFKNITSNNANAIIELEKRMTKEAKEIVLPKDFDAEMTGVLVTEDSVTLDKNDGKSINSNNTTITSTLEDKYDVSEKTLSKLKDDEKNVNELDSYQYTKGIDLEEMYTIDTEGQRLQDFYDINEAKLERLENNYLEEQGLNEYYGVNKETLSKIKDNYLEEQELKELYNLTDVEIAELKKKLYEESLDEDNVGDIDDNYKS